MFMEKGGKLFDISVIHFIRTRVQGEGNTESADYFNIGHAWKNCLPIIVRLFSLKSKNPCKIKVFNSGNISQNTRYCQYTVQFKKNLKI